MSYQELQEACRLCLSRDENNIDIFGEEGRKQLYQLKIWKHFSFWICEDSFPRKVCQSCCSLLEKFHSFFLKVEDVQKNILKMVTLQNYTAFAPSELGINSWCREIVNEQLSVMLQKGNVNYGVEALNNQNRPKIVGLINVRYGRNLDTSTSCESNIPTISVLKGQSLAAADADYENDNIIGDKDGSIKVEEGPLLICDNDINSNVNIIQSEDLYPEEINCHSSESEDEIMSCEFLSVELNPQANDVDFNNESVEQTNGCTEVALESSDSNHQSESVVSSIVQDKEFTKSVSNENAKETASTTDTNSCNVRGDGDHNQSDSGCNVSEDENENWEQSAISVHEKTSLPLNTQLAAFYKYNCTLCEPETVSFSSFFLLCKHCRLKHNSRGYVSCCERKLYSKMSLVSHMLKHRQPGLYKCRHCGKELASELTYQKHMVRHIPDQERPFKCEHCYKGFATKSELQSHNDRIHQPKDESLASICDLCGKKLANPATLISHKKYVHEKVRHAMCHICPKTFTNRRALKEHLYTHGEINEKIQCDVCEKWLKNHTTLRSHMQCHSNKLFSCPHCDKVYNMLKSLRFHLQTHSDVRPHKCLVCGKTFKRKQGLKTHVVQHTGEKPYQCPHCLRTFASSGNYYSHKKRMHSKEREIKLREMSSL
ncbi:zinc finger protein 774-like [Periplaneta americana]|uniref:zinc finger protein 774-like n=1 Tax=Periplaneta americana TaxID=6978 RepID=UPI0037E85C13